jgi:adenine/guanine/hypoxanthine permease
MGDVFSSLTRRFDLPARGATLRGELAGGLTTFLALSYILFVQPSLMAVAGIPASTALVATCVGSAFACVLMALLANYPVALAPGMGHNVFFAFTVCAPIAAGGLGLTWQQALAAVVTSGSLFVVLGAVRFRERILTAIPESLQHAIAAGIGLLIALLGLEWGGLVVAHPVTLVQIGDLAAPPALVTLFGLLLVIALVAANFRGAYLVTILGSLAAAIASGLVAWPERFVSFDLDYVPVLVDLDFRGLFAAENFVQVVLVLLFLDVFDTVGTLVGVGARAGLMKDGKLDRAGPALFADACGTVAGGLLGTSTITSYVESAAGVAVGARTGLATLVTAACFLLALPFHPLLALVGEGVAHNGTTLHPVLAPALIAVGGLMASSAAKIRFDDPVVGLPAFLAMVTIPLSFSITDGIAIGFIAASLAAIASGKPAHLSWLGHLLAAAFVLWHIVRH